MSREIKQSVVFYFANTRNRAIVFLPMEVIIMSEHHLEYSVKDAEEFKARLAPSGDPAEDHLVRAKALGVTYHGGRGCFAS